MANISPGAGVALGIIVGLLSTSVQSVGLTLQRKSHMLEDSKTDCDDRRPPYRRRRWQIGMFLFLLANVVGSTIQITTLPLPLLSTLQASGLVFNSLLASLLLGEPWTWRTAYGTVLVAAGAVLISLFSALPEPSHNLQQLIVLLEEPSFLVWFILSLVFVGLVLVLDLCLRKCIARQKRESARIRLIRGMSYGMVSGILSAHALLLAKSAVELIVRSLADRKNEFRGYQSWLLILAFLVLALSQLYYLHLGLKLISTSVLYPFVFCIYNIVAILDGLIYFRQMDRLPPLHAGLIALGTVILLSGVLALSWRLQEEEDQDHHQHAEIPQTLLAPGSGFVADPDDDTGESVTVTDIDESETERSALLPKTRARSKGVGIKTNGHRHVSRKRKRAATLRDVSHIWHEPDQSYGTLREDGSRSDGRPAGSRHSHSERHRRSSTVGGLEGTAEAHSSDSNPEAPPSLPRSHTMPDPEASAAGRRARHSEHHSHHHHEGGALFSDMLRREWWWRRRERGATAGDGDERDEDEAEDGGPVTHGRRS